MSKRILFLEDGLCGGKEGAFGHIARTLIYNQRLQDMEVFYYESETNTFSHLVETGFKNIVGRNASHIVFCLGHELLVHPEIYQKDIHALPIFFRDLSHKVQADIHVVNFPELIFETGTSQHNNLMTLNSLLMEMSEVYQFQFIDMNKIFREYLDYQIKEATVHRSLHHGNAKLNLLGQQFYASGILESENFGFIEGEFE